jgi:hypothetical protein
MTDEIDFFRAAKLWIETHGINAIPQAQSRLDHFEEKGDHVGSCAWKQIMAAVHKLQLEKQPNETIN